MHSLFIDSTAGLIIGLLDANYSWLEYTVLDAKKPSEVIHFELFSLLKKYNLKLTNVQCFISSGPGSYTGMRLSEGLAQVFELEGMKVLSFYHFDIPRFMGVEKGFWISNAFKGQVFIYNWNRDLIEKNLVNQSAFVVENSELGYTLDVTVSPFESFKSTKELIKNHPKDIFSKINLMNLRVQPYYFRPLEEEFK